MHIHREHSQVRSALIDCESSDGSGNSTHSRGKSRETSRGRIRRAYETNTLDRVRLGVLDVGSNTVHLLVVDAHRGAQPVPQLSRKSELRLAEHIEADGDLSRAGANALVGA